MALAAYRHLLRSARIAFRDDARLLTAAHDSARQAFENNRLLLPNGTEALGGIAHAEEVARVLRHNVVQGVRQDGENRYKLRIHERIEKGDNESIKMKSGTGSPAQGQCCGAQ